jgi:diacylglycerol kinase family enzyme
LRWLSQALTTGRHIRHKEAIHLADQDSITISARRPVPLQADGEYLGEVTSVSFSAVPNALPVWA